MSGLAPRLPQPFIEKVLAPDFGDGVGREIVRL
jgi:hypothetical protein